MAVRREWINQDVVKPADVKLEKRKEGKTKTEVLTLQQFDVGAAEEKR